jgi:hypothetical protein
MTRRRLFYWYAELRALEASFDSLTSHKQLIDKQTEIDRIERCTGRDLFSARFCGSGV